MSARTVLVTGAAGFLGSALVDRLLAEDRRVVAVDDLSSGSLANLDDARRLGAGRFEFHRADVVRGGLDAVVQRHGPEVVVHLAGPADAGPSIDDPVQDAMVTVVGTIRVAEAARRHGVRKIVSVPSGALHGSPEPGALPVAEATTGPATTPQGAAQRSAEEYLRTYAATAGPAFTSLVLAEVYGPRQPLLPGSVTGLASAMLEGRPVHVPASADDTRDLLFVDDAVHAIALAMEHGDGERCNVGTGARTSTGRLVAALAAATAYEREPVFEGRHQGVSPHMSLDPRRAAQVLGWKPWTTLEEGLALTLRWAGARLVTQ